MVCKIEGSIYELLDDHNRNSTIAYRAKLVEHLLNDNWGKPKRKLVSNDESWADGQGARQSQHLLLAA